MHIEPRPSEFGSLRLDYLEKGRLEAAEGVQANGRGAQDMTDGEGVRGRRRQGGRGTVGGRGGGMAGRS